MKTMTNIRTLAVLSLISFAGLQAQTPATAETSTVPDRATVLAEARAGNWERADAALATVAAATPADVEVCALLALHRLEQRRNKEAVALAERAAEAAPNSADLQSLLGRAYGARIGELAFIQQGMMAPKMLRAFKRSVELDPNHVPGLIGLASYYLNSPAIAGGSYEKAEEYAGEVEKRDAFNGALLRARIRERQEQWPEAATCYRAALALQPQNAWLLTQLGDALAKAGQKAEAKTAFESALQLQPDFAPAREGLQALASTPAS
jgi:Flp pilus assembly protein TadD